MQALESLCVRCTKPGAERLRLSVESALVDALKPSTPQPVRVLFARRLQEIGGEGAVPKLAELLGGDDAQLREISRRALVSIGSEAAMFRADACMVVS